MIGFWADFFAVLQVLIGLFLIFIIMLQRGKGGGLVGALGGMGGASAFGPKADIQVLKLTIGLAMTWVVIACVGIFFNRAYRRGNPTGDTVPTVKSTDKEGKGETGKGEPGKDGDGKAATDKADPEKKAGKAAATDKSEKADGKLPAEKADPEEPATKKTAAEAEAPKNTNKSEPPAKAPDAPKE